MVWRLSAGPVSISYLTPYFESALSPASGRYTVRIDDTILDWSDEAHTINVKLLGSRVLDTSENVVLLAPETYVSLSLSALMRGEIAPRTLSIAQPNLRIVRTEDGEFVLGIEGRTQASTPEGEGANFADILNGDMGRAARYLTSVNIVNAELAIDDRLMDIKWSAPDVNISLDRTPTGVSGVTNLDFKVGEQTAAIQLNVDYHLASGDLILAFGFADLRPSALASVTDRLAGLGSFDVPMGGSISVDINRDGEIVSSEFNLVGGAGRIGVSAPLPLDLPITHARVRGSYAAADALLKVDELSVTFPSDSDVALPAPIEHSFPVRELTATGTWSVYANQIDVPGFKLTLDRPVIEGTITAREADGGFDIDTTVKGTGFLFDDIGRYWPAKMGVNPRRWILKHMTSGRLDDAHATAALRWTAGDGFGLAAITGELLAKDLLVDYLPPLPKITKGIAHAKFNEKQFKIDVLGGEAGGLSAQGNVLIDNLDEVDQWTDLDLKVVGPLSATLATLDSEPFRFARAVGLSSRDAKGDTSTRLKMRFIAEDRLTVDEIKVNAESDITDAGLPGVAFGLPLSDGKLKLVVDNAGMDVKGTATLGGLPSEFEWRQNFGKKGPFATRYRVKTSADATVWRDKAGLTSPLLGPDVLAGPMGAQLEATIGADGRGTLSADISLDGASLTLAPIGYTKAEGDPASATIIATLAQGKVAALPKISVSGKDLAIEADVIFESDGSLGSARIARLAAGETDMTGTVLAQTGGWKIDLRGPKLDLKQYMEDKTPDDPNKQRGASFAVAVNVDKARLYEDRYVNALKGTIDYDGLVSREVHLDGTLVDGGSLKIEIVPHAEERTLSLTSDNAGGVLRAFDVSDNVVGGKLDITGSYAGMVPGSCLGGRVAMDNYRVRNAPIMARLLNVASVVGLLDALRGEGIGFDTLRVLFTRKDGITRFENAKASGLSIGLTASGSTNSRDETIDIEGDVIPANVLNGLLGRIPLVGGIFGGDGGVFAINYKISGHEKDPDVSANPLTVVTPGFTRKIFNLFDSRDDETPPGCPKAS